MNDVTAVTASMATSELHQRRGDAVADSRATTLIYGPSVACHCVDIKMGSYDNQVEMRTPWGQQVCIDTCLATIVAWLWHHGVTTLNSCCGHGKLTPSVIVSPDAIDLMYQLGFQLDDAGSAVPDQTFSLVRLSENRTYD